MESKSRSTLPTRITGLRPFEEDRASPAELPLYLCRVGAGFSSPADDHVDQRLDLVRHLVKNPTATILGWASGDSMVEYGVHHGDLLVINCAAEPRDGDVVAAALDGEMLVKLLRVRGTNGGRQVWLVSGDDATYPPIEVLEGHELVIRGVVEHVIHSLR